MRARRVDANQAEIIERLRSIGAKVYIIEEPVDLLVGYRGKSVLLEIKAEGGRITKQQAEFFATWPGGASHYVRSADEAADLIIKECA